MENEVGTEIDLDDLDYRILSIMKNQNKYSLESRPLSTAELSRILKKLGVPISQPSVFRRLKKLREGRVILRDAVDVDYDKLGLRIGFILKLKVNPVFYNNVAHKLAFMREIADLYRTSEDYGLLAIVQVQNVHEYNKFIVKLYDLKSVIDTFSILILEERKIYAETKDISNCAQTV